MKLKYFINRILALTFVIGLSPWTYATILSNIESTNGEANYKKVEIQSAVFKRAEIYGEHLIVGLKLESDSTMGVQCSMSFEDMHNFGFSSVREFLEAAKKDDTVITVNYRRDHRFNGELYLCKISEVNFMPVNIKNVPGFIAH